MGSWAWTVDNQVLFLSKPKIIDCLSPISGFTEILIGVWDSSVSCFFFRNVNLIFGKFDWQRLWIVKADRMMPGGLSGADWSWVGAVWSWWDPGQAGSGPRVGSRTLEESGGLRRRTRPTGRAGCLRPLACTGHFWCTLFSLIADSAHFLFLPKS